MRHAVFLSEIFPNAKFVFVVRDGRAMVNSVMSRQIHVGQFEITDYR